MSQPINRSPKTTYYIRIAAGGYLLYTAYSLNRDWGTVKPEHRLGIGAAIVAFAIIGFILCLASAISLYKYKRTQPEQDQEAHTDEVRQDHIELMDTDAVDSAGSVSEDDAMMEASGFPKSESQEGESTNG